jgi:hypothetical protein
MMFVFTSLNHFTALAVINPNLTIIEDLNTNNYRHGSKYLSNACSFIYN